VKIIPFEGRRVPLRFSLQDSRKEASFEFKNMEELTALLEKWMKDSSENDSTIISQKEK